MTCKQFIMGNAVGVVCVGGPDRKIRVGSQVITFEDHELHGPTPLKKNGDVRELGPRHQFWTAVSRWYEDGKKIDADGLCEWTPEPEIDLSKYVRVGRNLIPIETYERLSARLEERRK